MNDNTYATIGKTLDIESLKEITLFYKGIANTTSYIFEPLDNQTELFYIINKTVIYYLSFHELVHVLQLKSRRLTKAIYQIEGEKNLS